MEVNQPLSHFGRRHVENSGAARLTLWVGAGDGSFFVWYGDGGFMMMRRTGREGRRMCILRGLLSMDEWGEWQLYGGADVLEISCTEYEERR